MTFDEYISDLEARRDALQSRLSLIRASDISADAKNELYEAISEEAKNLRLDIEAALRAYRKNPS